MTMKELNVNLKNTLVLTNEGGQPIIINNATVTFKSQNLFLEGEIAFSAFENIVDEELLGFDIDFVRPMEDGNMMLVGKKVNIKMVLLPAETLGMFDVEMNQEVFERQIISEMNNSESELFQEYNWLVMELYQTQGAKNVGHETIWNLLDYEDPDLVEDWDRIVDEAAQGFMVNDEKIEELFDSIQNGDISKDDLAEMMKKAKDQMMSADNPMSGMLSKMFGEGEDFEKTLSESMDMLMDMFGSGNEEDNENGADEMMDIFEMIEEVISEHLEMLELDYEFDEEEMIYMVKYESMTTKKIYDTVIACGDNYIHVLTMNDQPISKDKNPRLYRLLNGLNAYIKLGKIILDENSQQLIFRTELSTPVSEFSDEPIIDIIDENWTQSEDAFTLVSQYLDGKLTYDEVMEEAIEIFV